MRGEKRLFSCVKNTVYPCNSFQRSKTDQAGVSSISYLKYLSEMLAEHKLLEYFGSRKIYFLSAWVNNLTLQSLSINFNLESL